MRCILVVAGLLAALVAVGGWLCVRLHQEPASPSDETTEERWEDEGGGNVR